MALLSGWQPGVSVASSATLIEARAVCRQDTAGGVADSALRGVERTVEDWTPFLRISRASWSSWLSCALRRSVMWSTMDAARWADIVLLGNAPALEVVGSHAEVFASMVR